MAPGPAYLPLLLLPGRVQQEVPIPVVLLLHVGLRPAGCVLVISRVIIDHVNQEPPECATESLAATTGKKNRQERRGTTAERRTGATGQGQSGLFSALAVTVFQHEDLLCAAAATRKGLPVNGVAVGGTGRSYKLQPQTSATHSAATLPFPPFNLSKSIHTLSVACSSIS